MIYAYWFQGALFGSLIGFGMSSWVSVGAYVTKPSIGTLPTSVENCAYANTSDTWWTTTTDPWGTTENPPQEYTSYFLWFCITH